MVITIQDPGDQTIIISISGRLNAVSAPELKTNFKKQVELGKKEFIVDLKETSFIDTSGLSTLVSGLKMIREVGGTLRLAGLNDQTMTVFKITMLDRVFEIFATKDEALKMNNHSS